MSANNVNNVSPLFQAIEQHDAPAVRQCVANGDDVNQHDQWLGSPLLVAVQQEQPELVRLLVELGADPNTPQCTKFESPLSWSAMQGDRDMVQLLLDLGADPNAAPDGNSPLMSALAINNIKIAKMLLDAGADVHQTNRVGVSALSVVRQDPPSKTMQRLIEKAAGPNSLASSPEQANAAGQAIQNKQLETLQTLLDAGLDTNAQALDTGWMVPVTLPLIHLAVVVENDPALKLLLERNANPNQTATVQNVQNVTPLMLAAGQRKLPRVKLLLQHGADVHARDSNDDSALSRARQTGTATMVKHLEKIVSQDSSALENQTFQQALRNGLIEQVRTYLQNGTDVNAKDEQNRVPIMDAIEYNNPAMLQLLIQHGAKLNIGWEKKSHSTWNVALRQPAGLEFAQVLLDNVDNPFELTYRPDALSDTSSELWAAVFGMLKHSEKVVQLLLDHGLSATQRFDDGSTPLLEAAQHGGNYSLKAITLLLQAGADPHQTKQPDPAVQAERERLAREMESRGMKPAPPRKTGKLPSALDIAKGQSRKVYQLLVDFIQAEPEPFDLADAILADLPALAQKPAFVEWTTEIEQQLHGKTRSAKKKGVLQLRAKLPALPAIADETDDDPQYFARLEPLQRQTRDKGFFLLLNELDEENRQGTRLILVPTNSWIAALRAGGTSAPNHGKSSRDLVEWLLELEKNHPFDLLGAGRDFLALRLKNPVDDYQTLHQQFLEFCPDLSDGQPETAEGDDQWKEFYQHDRRLYLWWD